MRFVFMLLVIIATLSVSGLVILYTDMMKERKCRFRIVLRNGKYRIQRHVLNVGSDGIRHSAWEYESRPFGMGSRVIEFDEYMDAVECVRDLIEIDDRYSEMPFNEYLKKKSDRFSVMRYFE